MNHQSTETNSALRKSVDVKRIVTIALMAAVCCILGPLSLPIGPVPISLTVFAAFLTVYVLGMKDGTIAYVIFLLLGLVGLPVFSGFAGGAAKLFGPTGGYLFGLIASCLIAGYFIDRFKARQWYLHIVGMILGVIACYLCGTFYFMLQMSETFAEAMGTCVIPFIPVDAIKVALACLIGTTLRKALSAAGGMHYKNL